MITGIVSIILTISIDLRSTSSYEAEGRFPHTRV
jgi:hypothetical protein